MDWKRFDRARSEASPIGLDLIESYAQGKVSRRNFVKRGTIIGLSVPFMGGIIAACGGGDDDASPAGTDAPTDSSSEATGEETANTDAPVATAPPNAGGELIAGIQTGDANSGLDPLNMLDLGTYAVCSQSFEYLVGLGDDGNIAPSALATSWEPNGDGTAWTFNLREGVEWMDGSGMLTSADVAATIDRMAAVGAGLAGVVSEGAVETPDELTVVVNLDSANGNLPVLLSLFNPQSLITPADYESGSVLNERTTGTGPWMLDSFDPGAFRVRYVPNPNWWGDGVNLESIVLQGFDTGGTKVAALAAGEIDVIQDFSVNDGATLLDDANVVVLKPPSANHRQLWFNTQAEGSPFTDPLVRQAVCYAVNREQIVNTIYEGQAVIGNDHPISETLPFFDETQEQRPYDPEMAKQLLADAGFDGGIDDVLQVGDIGEVPQMAAIIQANLAEVGINVQVGVTPNSDFYGEYWCPGGEDLPADQGCGPSAPIGIVDYGHRPTPDIYFGRALATGGDWNSSNYASSEFDGLFGEYQAALDVDGQKAAVGKIQRLLHEDAPACYHTFFNYLSGHTTAVSGVETTALGHLYFQNASKT